MAVIVVDVIRRKLFGDRGDNSVLVWDELEIVTQAP